MSIHFYVNDHLLTPQQLLNEDNEVSWQAEYAAFGDVDISVEEVTNNHRFPGQYFDAESGLHYNWNRYYDPRSGRYVTSDPIGLGGGLNTYGYVYQNPLSYTDLDGLRSRKGRMTGSLEKPSISPKRRCQLECWDDLLLRDAAGLACAFVTLPTLKGAFVSYIACRSAVGLGHYNFAACMKKCEDEPGC